MCQRHERLAQRELSVQWAIHTGESTLRFEDFASQLNDYRMSSVTLISRICVGDMTHEIV